MNTYKANYLIQADVKSLDILDYENSDVKILEVKKISAEDAPISMFNIELSFCAANNIEALRMAAINTDSSILQFSDDYPMINYNIKLERKLWLTTKILENQSYSCAS